MDGNSHSNVGSRPYFIWVDSSNEKELHKAAPLFFYELLISGFGS